MSTPSKIEDATHDSVVAFLIETLQPYRTEAGEPLSAATTIEAVGIDSFDFVEILFKIEDHYGIDLDFNANLKFTDLKTIGDLAGEIASFKTRKIAA
ncbi:hypothetical protein ASG40_11355 [Methylobacterium sp. Leaf399]|uniref:acyl carrier protein n=1 Tax=unclassified Methylobacterium TaxID=2615210 RepID=UPI0006F610CE|nr:MULTISPECIES: acyl carrier protein [unclassified Methylobacterium]KQP54883.1 hypothetical protein ASF39_03760 [Methylobacterium sp. Leaf108]KQT09221.1 hypothetical protein ASG40_11355 [Methylobacterium sp. Leaf399]KQT78854.1 hypothetical protein ASG59_06660 [Methylobacterium sp. Leaf466]